MEISLEHQGLFLVFKKDQETTRAPGIYRSQMRVLDLGLELLLVVSCHGGAGSWTPVSEEAVKALNRWAISQVLAASTFFIDLSQMFKELHSWLTVKQEVERVSPGSGSDSCGCQRFLEQLMTQSQQCSGDYSTTKSLRNVHLTTVFYSWRNGDSVQLIQFLTLAAYEHYL